jgi:hypothetical protein
MSGPELIPSSAPSELTKPIVVEPTPKGEPLKVIEVRARYFAPAGYSQTAPSDVPYKAPGLRKRLEQFSGWPSTLTSPTGHPARPTDTAILMPSTGSETSRTQVTSEDLQQ